MLPLCIETRSWVGLENRAVGGEGGTLRSIFAHPPISSKNNARRRVTDYTNDYTVDYCSDQRRRIARLSAAVNVLGAERLRNLIQS